VNINCIRLLSIVGLIIITQQTFAENKKLPESHSESTQNNSATTEPENSVASWKGSIEYGVIATSGNTNTRSESAKVSIEYKKTEWTNTISWSFLKASDSGNVSADQMFIRNYTKYSIINDDYLFLSLHSEKDRFSGFTNRTTETIGYGFSLIKIDYFEWDVELGAGARQSTRTDALINEDLITRIGTNVSWKVNENSQIFEELFMEKGKENTFIESLTTIKLKINDSLALHLNLKIKNNSIVPEGIKQTDTQTTINIVYDF